VQSLAPISSRPFESAAAGAAGAAAAESVFEDEPPELHARTAPEQISKKKIVFFIVALLK
jgi:hypothetical protein